MPEPPYNTLYFVCQRQTAISGIVVNDTWENLQPSPGATIYATPLDSALAAIARYNKTSGQSLTVRLRIWGGIDAPAWAKALDNGPVTICNADALPTPTPAPTTCPSVAQRTVGKFWTKGYRNAFRALQRQLARRYDGAALISEVAVTSCDSLTDEPFVVPEDPYSLKNLRRAGYTDKQYQTCLSQAISNDYAPYWHIANLSFSFNPFRRVDDSPPVTDLAFTKTAIAGCRSAVRARCVIMNQTLAKFTPPPPNAPPSTGKSYYEMWRYMRNQGGPISFQSASPPKLFAAWGGSARGWNAAVRLAKRFGASSLEVFPPDGDEPCVTPARQWIAGYTCFSATTLARWKAQILSE